MREELNSKNLNAYLDVHGYLWLPMNLQVKLSKASTQAPAEPYGQEQVDKGTGLGEWQALIN